MGPRERYKRENREIKGKERVSEGETVEKRQRQYFFVGELRKTLLIKFPMNAGAVAGACVCVCLCFGCDCDCAFN